jgi:hypothetical protein
MDKSGAKKRFNPINDCMVLGASEINTSEDTAQVWASTSSVDYTSKIVERLMPPPLTIVASILIMPVA